jgi:hypothetical protein
MEKKRKNRQKVKNIYFWSPFFKTYILIEQLNKMFGASCLEIYSNLVPVLHGHWAIGEWIMGESV